VLEERPWLWETMGTFITPCFPNFDPNYVLITKMLVLYSIQISKLPLCYLSFFEDIANH